MPLIKPRTRGKQLVRHITRLDRENNETLYAYAHFLDEPTEYVLNQAIETVLARDKEFLAWRAEHPESYVPRVERRSPRARRRDQPPRPGQLHLQRVVAFAAARAAAGIAQRASRRGGPLSWPQAGAQPAAPG